MAILNVNPTRMELLKLKGSLTQAKRGHKLLKDKQDGLMSFFMEMIRDIKKLREDIEKKISKSMSNFFIASSTTAPEFTNTALFSSETKVSLEKEKENIMGVEIPKFSLKKEGKLGSYGFLQTSSYLDLCLKNFDDVFDDLIKLAEMEKGMEILADEIEKTRQRVNALEYKRIPDIEETIKFISMKLFEDERMSVVSTMIVKENIEKAEKDED